MKTLNYAVLLVALCCSMVPAQGTTHVHTLPEGWEITDGGYSPPGSTPFNTQNSSRWQWTYDWTSIHHQFPIMITELAFRRSSEANMLMSTYTGCTLTLSSCATDHAAMSATFANNLDADAVTVFAGDVVIPSYTAAGATPAPFNVRIVFQTPFMYDPTKMKDLVVDFQTGIGTPVGGGGFPIDGVYPTPNASQNGHTTDGTSLTRNWNNPDASAILEITYTAGTGVGTPFLDITAFTTGLGFGDLLFSVDNLAMLPNIGNITRGYTIISDSPATEFGKGALFGVNPTGLTIGLLASQPLAPGNPLAFTVPGPASGFPMFPVLLPPGAVVLPPGSIWEVSVVLVNAGGQVEAISPVRQLVW